MNDASVNVGDEHAREGATIEHIYRYLRKAILECEIAPGSQISQVQLAKQFGVSRTPLREALRLLEREGLVESEHNRRVRVTGFSIDEFEQIAAERILLETLVSRVSMRVITPVALDELDSHLCGMADAAANDDYRSWQAAHIRFHSVLTSRGGPRMVDSLQRLTDLADRYRRIYLTEADGAWKRTIAEHQDLLTEIRSLDVDRVGNAIANYLARAALRMIRAADPGHDPVLITQALHLSTTRATAAP